MSFFSVARQGTLLVVLLIFGSVFSLGCPGTTTAPDGVVNDGGTIPEKKVELTCEKGTTCLKINVPGARSCDVLLKNNKKIEESVVNFDDSVIGQFKVRDTRLAMSFLLKTNEPISAGTYPVLVKIKDGGKELAIDKATCFDEKGAKIDKAEVSLDNP